VNNVYWSYFKLNHHETHQFFYYSFNSLSELKFPILVKSSPLRNWLNEYCKICC